MIVSLLTEELVRRGHDVTLFASGDSITKAKLFSVTKEYLRKTETRSHRSSFAKRCYLFGNGGAL